MVSRNTEAVYRKWNQRRWSCSLENCCRSLSWENGICVWSRMVQISNRDDLCLGLPQAHCPRAHDTSDTLQMTDFTPNVVQITSSKCVWPEIWPVLGVCSWEARSKTHNHSHLQSIIVCQVSFPTNASIGQWKNIQTADRKYPGPPSSCWLVFILSRNILFLFFSPNMHKYYWWRQKKIHGHFVSALSPATWNLSQMESSSQDKASRRSTTLFSDVLTQTQFYR